MAPRWIRKLFGIQPTVATEKTLLSYRASFAQYVEVRTFHSNVQHWLHMCDLSLEKIEEDGEYDRATHPQTTGPVLTDMELWFSDDTHLIHPKSVWPTLKEKRDQLTTALTQTTLSTQGYHRRMTKGLYDDLVVIEKALFDVEEKYVQHKRTVVR